MDLLQNGVDRTVIALWLGHESVETTQIYLHADMKLKEKALSRTPPLGAKPGRYRRSTVGIPGEPLILPNPSPHFSQIVLAKGRFFWHKHICHNMFQPKKERPLL